MFLSSLKSFFKTVFALALLFGFALLAGFLKDDLGFSLATDAQVRKEYYLYSASSQAVIKESVTIEEWLRIKGESATFVFETENQAKAFSQRLLQEKKAMIVMKESAAGVESVYAYAEENGAGVDFGCGKINLHIARKGNTVCVGAPIVFGGF
ncbi:MAG: hypothetical protein IJX98_06550 [Clostridia bacterium]|nr:hypothetical protein [Clostridia bacterium]